MPRRLRPNTLRKVIVWWLLTRSAVIASGFVNAFPTSGDLYYYFMSAQSLVSGVSPTLVLTEYPTPVVWVLIVPYILGTGTYVGFFYAFVGLLLVLDAAFTYLVWSSTQRTGVDPAYAIGFWCLFAVAMGEIMYTRLDLLPTLAGAIGILAAARRHHKISGSIIAVGAALKLWPALLLIPLLTTRGSVRKTLCAFLTTGISLASLSFLYGGWERLVSPLIWQSDRGLQIESVWATPAMFARLIDPSAYTVGISSYQAVEVFGTCVNTLLSIASMATLLGCACIVALFVQWIRVGSHRSPQVGALLAVAVVMILIVSNKTFSTQYMIWLGGLITVARCLPRLRGTTRNATLGSNSITTHMSVITLLVTALTQLVYPTLYTHFIHVSSMSWVATGVLATRNLAIVSLAVSLVMNVFSSFSRSIRLGPQPPLFRPNQAEN